MSTWEIRFTIKDQKGKTSQTLVHIPVDDYYEPGGFFTWNSASLYAEAIAPFIDNAVTGQITKIHIGRSMEIPAGLKLLPGLTSDVEERGVFPFKTILNTPTKITLASLKDSKVIAGTDTINSADADISLFIAAITGGLDLGSPADYIYPSDNRGVPITQFFEAYERFKRS